ncbi:MAG: hypothetical protein HDR50_08360 [Desulfovibrio sp.]|uniref:AIPR family protein n=1 Tax=Desulfovibrio sp. TaxID=885 RepID=UPI001A691054|nr:AIPR family protein [Desulfovibrio sp.]MBD5417650.1 hypothetical protein [Desulfovibrio sp.]
MQNAILTSYLSGFSDDFGYRSKKNEDLFGLFSSYCVVCHNFSDKFDVEKSIVDGGNDTGIDAIAILINGKICHDLLELEDFISANNKIDVHFVFVQAKTSPKFDCTEISNFGRGVKDFFREIPRLPANPEIQNYRAMKDLIYKNARKFYPNNPSCSLYYVTTGYLNISDHLNAARKDIIESLSSMQCLSEINVEYVDVNKLYKMYQNIIRGSEKTIQMDHYIVLPQAAGIEEALLGRISCKEFLKLICDEEGNIDQNIFSDNIRDYLGTSNVNEEISNTIKDSRKKDYFIILNNGVTAVAKKIQRIKNNLLIENIQIVNGCQTSNVIYRNKNDIKDDMFLPIKIISTENQEIINDIIRSTNRQNKVEIEAFEALSEFHRKFELFCQAQNRNVKDNIYYERRSRQYATDETIKPIEIITLSNLLASSVAMFLEEPHSTHRYYGELLKVNKEKLFLSTHRMEPYYFAAYAYMKITKEVRMNASSKQYSYARYYALMYIWKILTKGEKTQLNSPKLAKRITEELLPILDDRPKFLKLCVEGITAYEEVAKKSGVEKKNIARTRQITESLLDKIMQKFR